MTVRATRGSGVDFFAKFAVAEGALAELVPEGALLVLPESLQDAFRLPEELGLTEDPEVGREGGFVLLSAGHPLLRSAAESVLARGDAGYAHIPWPAGVPPTPAALQVRARDRIHPDHGRVDVTSAPDAVFLTVVRVGAMVSFRLSIDEEVQELAERWSFEDGSEVPPELVARLSAAAAQPGAPPGGSTWDGGGVAAADASIHDGAADRASELSRQRAHRLVAQLEVVDDYYRRVLESVEERMARATEDRRRMLAAQADATRIEWERRRAEVADEMMPVATVEPFRLHVIGVPAWRVAAVVRRGARTYPLALFFVPLLAGFLPAKCPSCGSVATLVAGKERLACRACAKPESPPAAPVTQEPVDRAVWSGPVSTPAEAEVVLLPGQRAQPPKPAQRERAGRGPQPAARTPERPPRPEYPPRPERPAGAPGGAAARGGTSSRVTPKGSPGRVTPKGSSSSRLDKTGDRLTRLIWESVLNEEPLRRRDTVQFSPMEALVRLYGSLGPALAVGMRETERPRRFLSESYPSSATGTAETVGWVETSGGRELRFVFEWRSETARLLGITPWPLERIGPMLITRESVGEAMRLRLASLLGPPPFSPATLDPVARLLLRQATQACGLGYAARCVAAWWYLTEGPDGDELADQAALGPAGQAAPSELRAAGVEATVARRAGIRLTANAVAERYGCDLVATRAEIKRVQALVKEAPPAGW